MVNILNKFTCEDCPKCPISLLYATISIYSQPTSLESHMTISQNLIEIQNRIAKIAESADRDKNSITLIAVSKTFGVESIIAAIDSGQLEFGENRVQESLSKWQDLKLENPDVALHLLGPLQSNKVADAVGLFDAVHSVDREKIARLIADEMNRQDRSLKLFIQVNTGEEEQKSGILPENSDEFIQYCRDELGLDVVGLMCIPPLNENPGPHFGLLRKIAERNGLCKLSMGMSGDFESAIRLGATHLRIGTAIFGERSVNG